MKSKSNASIFEQPSAEVLAGFVAGEPVATDELVRLIFPQLLRWTANKYHQWRFEDVEEVVLQSVYELCKNHAQYNPHKSKVTTFVISTIEHRMIDLARNKQYNFLRTSKSLSHENTEKTTYNNVEEIDTETQLAREEFYQRAIPRLTPAEVDVLNLIRQNESAQEVFIEVLSQYEVIQVDPYKYLKNFRERLSRKLSSLAKELGFEFRDVI
jgi:hypothetical protein